MSHGAAAGARLHHVRDTDPGLRRVAAHGRPRYLDIDGALVRDPATLERIRSLAIPPAWTDVWICPDPCGHLQAVGRDGKDRKVYRYHRDFVSARGAHKYDRLLRFARRLPRIRAAVERDLRRPGLPRERVLAVVVRLLELTHQRVGNEAYARLNRSYGLTTLRGRHATVTGASIRFRFVGKGGIRHDVGVRDRRLAPLIRRTQELPGQHLFEYLDADGIARPVRSEDVNAYLRDIAGTDVTAKDFRTWSATVLAFRALRDAPGTDKAAVARRRVKAAIGQVAARLGNTATVCRASYVHPVVVDSWLTGELARMRVTRVDGAEDADAPPTAEEEAAVVRLLVRAGRQARAEGRRRRRAGPKVRSD